MGRRIPFKPFAPQAYEPGSWIAWTDADGATCYGQIIDQGPEAGLWWLTSLTADDRLETLLLHRLPNTGSCARRMRDERLARGEDEYLYRVVAAAYYLDHRGDMRAVCGDVIAPAVASDEPEAESLARNGQTALPLVDEAPAPADTPSTEGVTPMVMTKAPATPVHAVARELRRLGLKQGRGGDFRVVGHYVRNERQHTYVITLTRHADETIAANADLIERWLDEGPFPFRVDVSYPGGGTRPICSVRNGGGPRIRQTPAPAAAPVEEAPAAPAPAPAPAAPAPVEPAAVDTRDEYRQEQQADALGWSTAHADLVRAAAADQLHVDPAGILRRSRYSGGGTGRRVAAARLAPLEKAAFLITGEPGPTGGRRVAVTADGRRALLVWDRKRPVPVERERRQEHLPLRPLRGGHEAARRSAEFEADQARRAAAREVFYVELDQRHAEEEFEDRCWDAWAAVQGIRYRLGRSRPAGWAPTEEEAALHGLRADVVEGLRDEAAALAAAEVAEDPELYDGVPGIVVGPGVVEPGVHVEYLPQHRPGPRARHCHGGVVVSVGTTCVRWRPYKADKDVRTPLDHMRVDPCSHINNRVHVARRIAALDAGRKLPDSPDWCTWSLARHVEHAATQAQAQTAAQPPASPAPSLEPGPLVVVPCGAAKLTHAAPAADLYTGSYHRACARAAAALTIRGGTVLVLSALYGLTPLDRVIEPYDLKMGDLGSVTGAQLVEQARALGVDQAREVIVLAGAAYTAAARQVWPDAAAPLAGLGGMGYQLQRLAALAATPDATPRAPSPRRPEALTSGDTSATLECNLTLQSDVAMIQVSGSAPLTTNRRDRHEQGRHHPHHAGLHRHEGRRDALHRGHGPAGPDGHGPGPVLELAGGRGRPAPDDRLRGPRHDRRPARCRPVRRLARRLHPRRVVRPGRRRLLRGRGVPAGDDPGRRPRPGGLPAQRRRDPGRRGLRPRAGPGTPERGMPLRLLLRRRVHRPRPGLGEGRLTPLPAGRPTGRPAPQCKRGAPLMDMTAAYSAFALRHTELRVEALELQDGDRIFSRGERPFNTPCFGRVVANVRKDGEVVRFSHGLGEPGCMRDVRAGFIRLGSEVTILREKRRHSGRP
jgi:hypothetical protein